MEELVEEILPEIDGRRNYEFAVRLFSFAKMVHRAYLSSFLSLQW